MITLLKSKGKISFIFILLAAAFLRVYHLGKNNLWFDEALTLLSDDALQNPFYALTHAAALLNKNQPSCLYIHRFIFCHWKNIVGLDEFRLRLLPVIFGVLAVISIYILGRYLFNTTVGIYSALLLAFSPFHIYYSQEFRQYSLISFLTILSVYFLIKAMHFNKLNYWILFVLCLTVNIYMHYISVLIILGNLIFFAAACNEFKKSFFNFFISHLIVLFLLIPFFIVVTYFAILSIYNWDYIHVQLSAYLPTVHIRNLFFTFKNLSVGYSINFNSILGIFSTFLFFILFIYGVLKVKNRGKKMLLIGYSLVLIILVYSFSLYRVFYVDRHFIIFISFYYLGIAYGIYSLKKRLKKITLVALIIVLTTGITRGYFNILAKEEEQRIAVVKKKDYRILTEFLSRNYKKGDIIIHTCEDTTTPLKVYSSDLNTGNHDFYKETDKCRMMKVYNVSATKNSIIYFEWGKNIYDYPEIFSQIDLSKLNPHKNRIWLLCSEWDTEQYTPTSNSQNVLRILRNKFYVKYMANFNGVSIYLCTYG